MEGKIKISSKIIIPSAHEQLGVDAPVTDASQAAECFSSLFYGTFGQKSDQQPNQHPAEPVQYVILPELDGGTAEPFSDFYTNNEDENG